MFEQTLREQVFETAQNMVKDRLAYGAQGNVSAFDRQRSLVAITPTAIPYASMHVEDIVILDQEGKLVDALWRPTSETEMHLVFYRQRLEVNAVVHCHAPYATLFGVLNEPIPVALTEAAMCLGGAVEVAPYRRPGTPELAEVAYETMRHGVAVVLAQHGLLTVGVDLSQAYDTAMAAETSARIVYMARAMGREPQLLSEQEIHEMRRLYLSGYHPKPVPVIKEE